MHSDKLLQAYYRLPIKIVRGNGPYLYDINNKKYLDFNSGFATTNLGHNNQKINQKITKQINKLWHCSNLFNIPGQKLLAAKLNRKTFNSCIFFCSSGQEAVECAIKVIRKYSQPRNHIITMNKGFHGRSLATLSAGGNEKAQQGFEPLLDGFDQVEPNDINALKKAITNKTAAILLEPIQAEGGINILSTAYIRAVREIASQNNLILCFDEIQTGYGRTGKLFHYQNLGIIPDIITMAKGMGNGFPLGGCLIKADIAKCITPGTHGSTYGGNPLAMAVGNAVLDSITKKLMTNVTRMGKYLHSELQKLQANFPQYIKTVRGKGLLLGMELSISAQSLVEKCIENGLIVSKAGNNTVLRLTPPLIIDKQHVDKAVIIIKTALQNIQ